MTIQKTLTQSETESLLKTTYNHIAIVGLGYVGLPLFIEFAKKYTVTGFDISNEKITQLQNNIDVTNEISTENLKKSTGVFSHNADDLKAASVKIVTVPTPIDDSNHPNLTPLKKASETLGKQLKKDDIIVYESTVYPGVTDEVCIPILEKESGLTYNKDFFVGYSPERLSPGESNHTLTKIIKVVAGSTAKIADILSSLYGSIIPAGIHKASSIKVAEAAKVLENTQRDLNVALMNELAIICHKLDMSTLDVIEAASTKWNFMKMTPGLVGGHCIGVDPYYLTYKAEQLGYHPQVILAGRRINDNMGAYIGQQTVKQLIKANKHVKESHVLILGITFKENVADIRNSKVIDVVKELKEYGINVSTHDPLANPQEVQEEYGIELSTDLNAINKPDAIICAVKHKAYIEHDFSDLLENMSKPQIIIDIKGLFKNHTFDQEALYWEL